MAKKIQKITEIKPVEPVLSVEPKPVEPVLTAAPIATATDFNKLIDQAKKDISSAPTKRVRRTQAEIAAAKGAPANTIQPMNVPAAISTLTPEQAEMRVRKISALLQAGSAGWSQILIKSEHMAIDSKVADAWSKDLIDVVIAYPELETYFSPKTLAVAGLLGSTAMIVASQVAMYKAYLEVQEKKNVKPTE